MKLNIVLMTALVALTPAASAWRVRFYEHKNFGGREHTRAGPGNPGSACQGAPNPINNKVSSFKFWPENSEGTTSCCLQLFNSLNCEPSSLLSYPLECKHNEYSDLASTPLQDKISSYRTVCRRI